MTPPRGASSPLDGETYGRIARLSPGPVSAVEERGQEFAFGLPEVGLQRRPGDVEQVGDSSAVLSRGHTKWPAPDLFADESADATEAWHAHEAATHVFALPDDTATSLDDLSLAEWTKRGTWTEFRPPDEDLERGDAASLNWGTPHGRASGRNASSTSSRPTPT